MKSMKSIASIAVAAFLLIAGCTQPEPVQDPSQAGKTPESETTTSTESSSNEPLAEAPAEGDEVAVLETDEGRIILMFYPQVAPNHVENFKSLVKEGFYDGTRFHRCIPGFMIQGGDPNSSDINLSANWGVGGKLNEDGSERNVKFEGNTKIKHDRGVLSMARSPGDYNSASSQFFIMVADNPGLDGEYSSFGRVVEGMDVADKIVKTGDAENNGKVQPQDAVLIKKATIQTWPVK